MGLDPLRKISIANPLLLLLMASLSLSSFVQNLQDTVYSKLLELESRNFERMSSPCHVLHVRCQVSVVNFIFFLSQSVGGFFYQWGLSRLVLEAVDLHYPLDFHIPTNLPRSTRNSQYQQLSTMIHHYQPPPTKINHDQQRSTEIKQNPPRSTRIEKIKHPNNTNPPRSTKINQYFPSSNKVNQDKLISTMINQAPPRSTKIHQDSP